MRKVMVSEHKMQPNGKWKLEEIGIANFHEFGRDYQEFESGAGNFSTAIVEFIDGTVKNVPVEHVRFLSNE